MEDFKEVNKALKVKSNKGFNNNVGVSNWIGW